jgi:rhamnose utilization protein RhaD (predicted bifunctional aldolase and dehydrogenase)/NAD(P)-dependent dehydrogenase (short-subunit alcohol dehydrogenase family)
MRSRWSDKEAAGFVARYGAEWGEPLALRTYSARLLGSEPTLVLHGGGNSSVKALWLDVFGEEISALFVKASGADMATIEPSGHVALDLEHLLRLRSLPELDDAQMLEQLCTHMLRADSPAPSIEALVHAFLPGTFVDHTHADAVLALTNRKDNEAVVEEALGGEVAVLPYVTPGFDLALATSIALKVHPRVRGLVCSHHGLITWGETARDSYEMMVDLVSHAESHLAKNRTVYAVKAASPEKPTGKPAKAKTRRTEVRSGPGERMAATAAVLRGVLAERTGDCDRRYRRVILQVMADPEVLSVLALPKAREIFVTPPLTTDHLIRTKALPLWVDDPVPGEESEIRGQLADAVEEYSEAYTGYLGRYAGAMPVGVEPFAPKPRVVMIPGLGIFCAGPDLQEARITRDITEHTIATKAAIAVADSAYLGLPEEELFAMEYRTLQHAKLYKLDPAPLRGHVALVTGAAGAIGTGICEGLLEAGCLVAATDLPGDPLTKLVDDLGGIYPGAIRGIDMDVTDPDSVAAGFAEVTGTWGGVDLVVPNAGIAAVGSLPELDLEEYRRLAHQLARVASLELAADDVRVNMVAPDAVFSCGSCRSGLWEEVGPERMKARGLDEAGLEAYYQERNLLKAQVTAAHVANAVLFFATRQTPTTGVTMPVDGGLPDSTPR